VLAEPGRAYAIYVNGGAQAELTLELPPGQYQSEWLNTRNGRVDRSEKVNHSGGAKNLSSPSYSEDIALRVKRERSAP
jgi:hypothetical protein